MFSFIRHTSLWFTISGFIIAAGFGAAAVWGFHFGLDFTGGTLVEATFTDTTIDSAKITQAFAAIEKTDTLVLGTPTVTPKSEAGRFIVRFGYLENEEVAQRTLVDGLTRELGTLTIDQFQTTEPSIGAEAEEQALRALVYVSLAIVLYLAATFRNHRTDGLTKYVLVGVTLAVLALWGETTESVILSWSLFAALILGFLAFLAFELHANNPSLKYGVCAIVALLHDVALVVGFYSIAGHFIGVEVDKLAVTALLTVMGFSVHDTIVVFDRLRENLKFQKANESLADVADTSLRQTLARSINTSLTALITLSALFWFGAESTRWFVAALIVGIAVGTYSSIFVATPLYVSWQKRRA